jgi:HD-GYP domain-containing protein (c-di-GMP phosphodiesterase class II)
MTNRHSFVDLLDYHPGQDAAALAAKALRQGCAIIGATAGVLYLLQHEKNAIRLVCAAAHPPVPTLPDPVALNQDSLSARVAQSGETQICADAPDAITKGLVNPAIDILHPVEPGMVAAVPLKNHANGVVGVMTLVSDPAAEPGFTQDGLNLLLRFNRLAGAAVEQADLLDRIEHSRVDDESPNEPLLRQVEAMAQFDDIDGVRGNDAFRLAISLLARAAEIYDEGTGNHIYRVNEYSGFLGQTMGRDEKYCHQLRYSAQLHDVGKMGVSPSVLCKTGALNPDERREMDNHTIYGHRILSHSPRLAMAAEIALNHHEKWDGTGYPSGKRGEEIPLAARIVQLADIYDALRAARPYKAVIDHERACAIILHGDERIDSKGHFDPQVVEAFGDSHNALDQIWQSLQDG